MKLVCEKASLAGTVQIPGSKSHTIRAVAIAALADGDSVIESPLHSADTRSAVSAYRALGASIESRDNTLYVHGLAGQPGTPDNVIDVGNSGTTLRIVMGSCALLKEGTAILTGDAQIRRRPAGPLAVSLTDLGAAVHATRNNGCAPFVVSGRLSGGETSIEAVTSQFVTSLLMCTPMTEQDSRIMVPLLHEKPYVQITLDWLKRQGITVDAADDFSEFIVPGGQTFAPVNRRIPGDFSSATFFLCAGALSGNDVLCAGLDMDDTQGDKAVVEYLRQMGAEVAISDSGIRVTARALTGCEIDLNSTPDALPMMAVMGCFAKGETRLVNVPQARLKETDRIAVMCEELTRMGADIDELEDGLVVRCSNLKGAHVSGHDDHRVVMALAVAASQTDTPTTIHGYEAVEITYPKFVEHLAGVGGTARVVD